MLAALSEDLLRFDQVLPSCLDMIAMATKILLILCCLVKF